MIRVQQEAYRIERPDRLQQNHRKCIPKPVSSSRRDQQGATTFVRITNDALTVVPL
jgi:hypothetical protein